MRTASQRRQPAPPPILIVDDNDGLRESLRVTLEGAQYPVLEASNGREALALLLGRQMPEPCLIVLDLQMPVMSGWEFLTAVESRATLATIPVIVLSALALSPRRNGHPSVAAWLQKPYDLDKLIPLVHAYAPRFRTAFASAI